MRDVANRTAFITGGAGGIGRALAKALLEKGASVMICDIERDALDDAVNELRSTSSEIEGVVCDVADRDAVFRAARTTRERFGEVHILCNNAGVSRAGAIERIHELDWQWVLGVNLMGTVHGIQAFLPSMKACDEECHIVNTSSMVGLVGGALSGPYAATKFGIVGITEVLAAELAGTKVGVSVLCPSWVRTRMTDNGRNRPEHFGGPFTLQDDVENEERNARYVALAELGLDPIEVAEMVYAAIIEGHRYIFTHPGERATLDEKTALLSAGFDAADRRRKSSATGTEREP